LFNINRRVEKLKVDKLADLLFILASIDRLTLLFEIGHDKLRLKHLTSKISATPQETSKHLTRLRNAKIVEKDSDGFFSLTEFGKVLLKMLPALRFVNQNKNYFLSHDISSLPLEFIERLGELQNSNHTEQVGPLLAYTQQAVRDAEDYIWLMADHPLGGEEYVGGRKLETSDVTWRIIIPYRDDLDLARLQSTLFNHKGRIEYALVGDHRDIRVGIVLNEKMAGLAFSDLAGRLDFNSGFGSSDVLFHKWCYDIFNYYWNKTRKKIRV
jgi:predicted transcriptional regulator